MDKLDEYLAELKQYKGRADVPRFSSIPRFSSEDGRTEAKVLFLLPDPGNSGASRTGVVDRDNPGPAAKNFLEANEKAGLDRKLTISWNIVPWPADENDEGLFASQVEDALPWLGKLLKLLPRLLVVVLLGNNAWQATRYLYLHHPGLHVLHGPHPRLRPHPKLSCDKAQERRAWLEATISKARRLVHSSD